MKIINHLNFKFSKMVFKIFIDKQEEVFENITNTTFSKFVKKDEYYELEICILNSVEQLQTYKYSVDN